jgi:hypothetical protein
LLVLALGLVVALGAETAPAARTAPVAEAQKRKPKPKKCKRTQVTVRVAGKKRCLPIRKAFPKPRSGDERVSTALAALRFDLKGGRDRRGRPFPSLGRSYGTAGRKISTALAATLPRLFSLLDGLGSPGSAFRTAPLAVASANDCGGDAGPAGLSGKIGGVGVGGSAQISGGKGRATAVADFRGYQVRTEHVVDCEKFELPRCPTAEGVLKGRWTRETRTSIFVFRDGELLNSTTYTVSRSTELRGQTADDAKLDHVDIDDTVKMSTHLGGSQQSFGPVSINVTLNRNVRVDMRTRPESYAAGRPSVSAASGFRGLLQVPRGAIVAAWQGHDDGSFARVADAVIRSYRGAESGGGFADTAGKCAELKFSPASETLTLRKNQTGTVRVRVESNGTSGNPRATAEKSRLTMINPQNATFSPASARGKQVEFDYTVTKAGEGVMVSAGFKATSTAGLAVDATWTQPTEEEATLEEISGTFQGFVHHTGAINFDWSGTITFTRDDFSGPGVPGNFTLTSGQVDVTVSGRDNVQLCAVNGTRRFQLGQEASGSFGITGGSPTAYTYAGDARLSGSAQVMVTLSSCDRPEDNGTVQPRFIPVFVFLTGDLETSAGLTFAGTWGEGDPDTSVRHDWSLRGELTP